MFADRSGSRPALLLVEDDPDQATILSLRLEAGGFSVSSVSNGAAALAALQDQRFHAVISDIHMPLLDGFQLCWLIKDDPTLNALPVVLLTSFQEPGRRFWARVCGADLFLPKHSAHTNLIPQLERLLARPSTSAIHGNTAQIQHGGLDLERVHHLLGKALEHRLRECALRGVVTNLSRSYHDVDKLVEGFLGLALDLVGQGIAYLFRPGGREHHLYLLASSKAATQHVPGLETRFRLAGAPTRLHVIESEEDGEDPSSFQGCEFGLPVWGEEQSPPARWGCLAHPAHLERARGELKIISEEYLPLFAGSMTLERLAESNLELKEAEIRKTRILDTLSHELRSPITALRLREEMVLMTPASLPEETIRLLNANQRVFDRLQRLLDGFLQLERIQQGALRLERTSIELQGFLQDQLDDLSLLARNRGVRLVFTMPEPCEVLADSDRLIQCITNLVGNAIAYSPEGGEVKVSMTPHGEHGRIRVQDQGPGVPKALQEHLFQPFHGASDRPDSVGLGLAITHALVQAMGGRISYEPSSSKGACFQLELVRVR